MPGPGEELARVDAQLLELLCVLLVVDLLRERVDGVLHALVVPFVPQELDNVVSVYLHGPCPAPGRSETNVVATVLVDAENVRRSLWPNIGRAQLEERCRAWAEANGHDVLVVWEGPQTADDRIAADVRRLTPPLWVATSDRELRERVANHVERVIGGGSFARQL